jgi:hypothetical protein
VVGKGGYFEIISTINTARIIVALPRYDAVERVDIRICWNSTRCVKPRCSINLAR